MLILRIAFILLFFLQSIVFADEDVEEITQSYNGIPGCECFLHCSCSTSIRSHPKLNQDAVWHSFLNDIWELNAFTCGADSKE